MIGVFNLINIKQITTTNYFDFIEVILERNFSLTTILEKEEEMTMILGSDFDNPESDESAKEYIRNNCEKINKYFKFENPLMSPQGFKGWSLKLSDEELLDKLFGIYIFWKYNLPNFKNIESFDFKPHEFLLGIDHLGDLDKVNKLEEYGVTEIKASKVSESMIKIRVINIFNGIDYGYTIIN